MEDNYVYQIKEGIVGHLHLIFLKYFKNILGLNMNQWKMIKISYPVYRTLTKKQTNKLAKNSLLTFLFDFFKL